MNNTSNNILITGGAGYIGSHIAEKFIKTKTNIIILDNLATGYRRLISKKLISSLKKRKIKIHIRSIFLQGLLLKDKLHGKFYKWSKIWSKIRSFKRKNKINNLAYCIQFIKKYPKIDNIIIGVESFKQIKEILNEFQTDRKIIFPNIECKDKKLINPSLW